MSLNILVVDDSAVMRQMILRVLRMAGLEIGEVHEAGNGREGLDLLGRHWVDLVFADINMPEMNGEEMIEKMRAAPETRATPVIVVSTEGSEARIEKLKGLDTRFVRKPFTPEQIRQVIQDLTGVKHESTVG